MINSHHSRGSRSEQRDAALEKDHALLETIKTRLSELEQLDSEMQQSYEDRIYRFYHGSFKVYDLQQDTIQAVALFRSIGQSINGQLCAWFEDIVAAGTGIKFAGEHNKDWSRYTRPQVEAFLHAKYFVEMMVKHGRAMDQVSHVLPSGWAAILELYGQR